MKLSIYSLLFTFFVFNAFGQNGTPHLELSEMITTENKNSTGNYNGYRSADERLVAYITAKDLNEIKGYEVVD